MARVFVSHACGDAAFASEVHRWLVEDEHEVFLDQDLRDGLVVGEDWERRLLERLRWADAVVCVLTSAYVGSTWCTAELVHAQARGSRLFPIRAEAGVAHPLLNGVQLVDAATDSTGARARLAEGLRRVDAQGGGGWPDDRSPFPGLRPFESSERRVFFGRSRDVELLAAVLRSPVQRAEAAVLLVVGPSGCGKSSLVRAGLLPVMAGEPGWVTLPVMLPGPEPVAVLVRELAVAARQVGLGWSIAEVRRRLDEDGLAEVADEVLLAARGPRRKHLLLVVDQFEELLTQAKPGERARFTALIGPALAGSVQVVATLRPEFLDQLLSSPELATLATRVHPVQPLRREVLRAVVEGPSQLAGIGVDAELVARLVDDTDTGEALPLLAFALAKLADGVGRGGRLDVNRYEQLGGVQGALARQADVALADATAATGQSAPQVLRQLLRLVTVDRHGRPTRWRVRRDELTEAEVTVVDCFVARRLLTSDLDTVGGVVVGVAHEALLSAWKPLAEAIVADTVALRARRRIDQAAADWTDNGHPPGRLWEGGQLAAALQDTGAHLGSSHTPLLMPGQQLSGGEEAVWSVSSSTPWWRQLRPTARHRELISDRVALSVQSAEFVLASIRRDRRRRGRSTVILSLLLVAALIAASTAFIQKNEADTQQRAAEEGQRLATARLLLTGADTALRGGDSLTALRLAEAAERIHPNGETRSGLIQSVLGTRYSGLIEGHTGPVAAVAFAPDGRTLATAGSDATGRLWDVGDPARPRLLGGPMVHTGPVTSVAFAPDGRTLASASDDKTVRLWDVSDPAWPSLLGDPLVHTGPVTSVAFAPDGRTLASASSSDTVYDSAVRLWDVGDLARPRLLGNPLTETTGPLVFAPDGRTLASADFGASVRLWDVGDLARPRLLGDPLVHPGPVMSVAFAPDGRTLAIANTGVTIDPKDEMVRLWDVGDPARPRLLGDPLVHAGHQWFSVAFAPDGRTLATTSDDHTVRLWDVGDPARPRLLGAPLAGHTGPVLAVAFAPDGRTLATASDDQTVRLWEVGNPTRPRLLGDPLADHSGTVLSVAFAPDGRTLATASNDATVRLWDVGDPARPRLLDNPLVHAGPVLSVAFAPDGRTLASASSTSISTGDSTSDDVVQLWDVGDPARPRLLGDPLVHAGPVLSVAFAPDGRTLASGSDDETVRLWDVGDPARPRLLGDPLVHTGTVWSVAFAPDGRTLASGSAGFTESTGDKLEVRLWDVVDPARPRLLGDPLTGYFGRGGAVAFTPNGRTLATTSSDQTVRLWNVGDPARPRLLSDSLVNTDQVDSVSFAPDGRILATVGLDEMVRLWDVGDPARPRLLGDPLTGHTGPLAFAPDGRTLASASALWDVASVVELGARPLERACAITQRGLNPSEWAKAILNLPYRDSCAE